TQSDERRASSGRKSIGVTARKTQTPRNEPGDSDRGEKAQPAWLHIERHSRRGCRRQNRGSQWKAPSPALRFPDRTCREKGERCHSTGEQRGGENGADCGERGEEVQWSGIGGSSSAPPGTSPITRNPGGRSAP